jgi:N-acyl-D-amino-acid deacylase
MKRYLIASMLAVSAVCAAAGDTGKQPLISTLIQHGTVIDGTGSPRRRLDVRIVGNSISQIGNLEPLPGERVIDAAGLVVAPGFIDAHSHADGGILEDPLAETQIRQGITTAIVGEDGGSNYPLASWFTSIEKKHVAINFASFVGHGTVRNLVTGKNYKRKLTADELARAKELVESEMQSGGLGLSTGLEYDPGFYSDTPELVELSKVAARYGGIYISHVRDEGT